MSLDQIAPPPAMMALQQFAAGRNMTLNGIQYRPGQGPVELAGVAPFRVNQLVRAGYLVPAVSFDMTEPVKPAPRPKAAKPQAPASPRTPEEANAPLDDVRQKLIDAQGKLLHWESTGFGKGRVVTEDGAVVAKAVTKEEAVTMGARQRK